ncbi:40S ribosomal protein S2-4 [Acorus gramineus]|uniref:40S ribosomal protein S2-4 n=1 Tax=Acorus gramineus TaxID=55184 RepID=A0AAV9BDY8_ACOGR|nr:40S ribosomal protein S2-4 [Acorus gramineus]
MRGGASRLGCWICGLCAEAVKDEILRSSDGDGVVPAVHEAPRNQEYHQDQLRRRLRLPDRRGSGIVAARVPKKVLQSAGIEDVFTSSRGSTKALGNFVKATFDCLMKTYGFLTPGLWTEMRFSKSPFQEHTDLLMKPTRQRWGCDRCSGTGARRRYSQSDGRRTRE